MGMPITVEIVDDFATTKIINKIFSYCFSSNKIAILKPPEIYFVIYRYYSSKQFLKIATGGK